VKPRSVNHRATNNASNEYEQTISSFQAFFEKMCQLEGFVDNNTDISRTHKG